MRERRSLVEHPFGTIKAWMGHSHFLMKRLPNVKTEISLHILAYNMKRVMAVMGELNRSGFTSISLVTIGSAEAP